MKMNKTYCSNGAKHITELISEAIRNGTNTAVVTGNWEIDTAVRLPSNFTLVLDGCHLKMADGCYSNLFVNEHHDTEEGKTTQGTDRNISIIGKNGAVLDGGNYNGLSERTQLQNGLPPIWKNNLIFFANVDGFEISNIACHNQRWWALNFIYCSNGVLKDIHFQACDIGIDKDGNLYHGLKLSRYEEVLIKNADGIDLRQGCHDISIENIFGFTEDDSVALTALDGDIERHFTVAGLPKDICNITIKNVATAAFCTNVRLLNQDGICLHDIHVDGVFDASENSPHMERGIYGVRVGDTRLYGNCYSTSNQTYNITIKNVRSRGLYAIGLAGAMSNIVLEGIEGFDGAERLLDDRTKD